MSSNKASSLGESPLKPNKEFTLDDARRLVRSLHHLLNQIRTWEGADIDLQNRLKLKLKLNNVTSITWMCLKAFPDLDISDLVSRWLQLWGNDVQYRTQSEAPLNLSRLVFDLFQDGPGAPSNQMEIDGPLHDGMDVDAQTSAASAPSCVSAAGKTEGPYAKRLDGVRTGTHDDISPHSKEDSQGGEGIMGQEGVGDQSRQPPVGGKQPTKEDIESNGDMEDALNGTAGSKGRLVMVVDETASDDATRRRQQVEDRRAVDGENLHGVKGALDVTTEPEGEPTAQGVASHGEKAAPDDARQLERANIGAQVVANGGGSQNVESIVGVEPNPDAGLASTTGTTKVDEANFAGTAEPNQLEVEPGPSGGHGASNKATDTNTDTESPDVPLSIAITIIELTSGDGKEAFGEWSDDEPEDVQGDDGKRRKKPLRKLAPKKRTKYYAKRTVHYPCVPIGVPVPIGCKAYFLQTCQNCERTGAAGRCAVQMDALFRNKLWRGPWSTCARCHARKRKCCHSTKKKKEGEGDEGLVVGVEDGISLAASTSGASTVSKSDGHSGEGNGVLKGSEENKRGEGVAEGQERTVESAVHSGAPGGSRGGEEGPSLSTNEGGSATPSVKGSIDLLVRPAPQSAPMGAEADTRLYKMDDETKGRLALIENQLRDLHRERRPGSGASDGEEGADLGLKVLQDWRKSMEGWKQGTDQEISDLKVSIEDVEDLKEWKSDFDVALTEVEKAVPKLQGQVGVLANERLPLLKGKIDRLAEAMEVHDDTCSTDVLKALKEHKAAQTGATKKVDARVDKMSTKLSALTERISKLEGNVSRGGGGVALKVIKEDIQALGIRIGNLEESRATKEELDDIKSEMEVAVQSLVDTLDEIGRPVSDGGVEDLDKRVELLESKVDEAVEDLADAKMKEKGWEDAVNSEREALKAQVTALEGMVKRTAAVAEMKDGERAVVEKVRMEKELVAESSRETFQHWMRERVGDLEGKISATRQSVEALAGSWDLREKQDEETRADNDEQHQFILQGLESTRARLLMLSEKDDMKTLATRMDTMEQDVKQLKAAVEKVTENVQGALTLSFTGLIENHLRTLARGIFQQQVSYGAGHTGSSREHLIPPQWTQGLTLAPSNVGGSSSNQAPDVAASYVVPGQIRLRAQTPDEARLGLRPHNPFSEVGSSGVLPRQFQYDAGLAASKLESPQPQPIVQGTAPLSSSAGPWDKHRFPGGFPGHVRPHAQTPAEPMPGLRPHHPFSEIASPGVLPGQLSYDAGQEASKAGSSQRHSIVQGPAPLSPGAGSWNQHRPPGIETCLPDIGEGWGHRTAPAASNLGKWNVEGAIPDQDGSGILYHDSSYYPGTSHVVAEPQSISAWHQETRRQAGPSMGSMEQNFLGEHGRSPLPVGAGDGEGRSSEATQTSFSPGAISGAPTSMETSLPNSSHYSISESTLNFSEPSTSACNIPPYADPATIPQLPDQHPSHWEMPVSGAPTSLAMFASKSPPQSVAESSYPFSEPSESACKPPPDADPNTLPQPPAKTLTPQPHDSGLMSPGSSLTSLADSSR